MNSVLRNLFRKKVDTELSDSANVCKQSKKKSKRKHKSKSSAKDLVVESKAVIAAQRFIEVTNKHDWESYIALQAPNCIVYFANAEILGPAFVEEFLGITKSFPDFKLSYERTEDHPPNIAKLINLRASGTHTGEPYGFGPYPAIEAKGCKVLNDPEETIITVDENTGLITKMQFIAKGPLAGPPGLYEQVGGILF